MGPVSYLQFIPNFILWVFIFKLYYVFSLQPDIFEGPPALRASG